jgi:hypothetical protein
MTDYCLCGSKPSGSNVRQEVSLQNERLLASPTGVTLRTLSFPKCGALPAEIFRICLECPNFEQEVSNAKIFG